MPQQRGSSAPGPLGPEIFDRILDAARRLASSSDSREVLAVVIDALRDTLRAERASVFEYDPSRHEFFATHAHGLPRSLRLSADAGIIGEAARTRAVINIPDAYADPRFNRAVDEATGFRTRGLLTIPLIDYDNQIVGVAQVLNKSPGAGAEGAGFDARDEMIASRLADQAGAALKRAALQESQRIKEKLQADLDVARRIQQATLPGVLPALAGYEIAGHFRSADETAGDAYDVIDGVGDAGSPGATLFMADATGHGIGPAISVAHAHSMLRMGLRLRAEVDRIAREINQQLCGDLPPGRFITAFFGRLDPLRHEIAYVSAGQAPILILHADSASHGLRAGEAQVLPATVMPLGIDPEFTYEPAAPIRLAPGDVFALLSDGFYEAESPSRELFGLNRVVEALRGAWGSGANASLASLCAAIDEFTASAPPSDDRTAVLIRRLPE